MRVQLPNGQIIDNVPEGTTKAQLAEKLQKNGLEVPKEWLAPTGVDELKTPTTGMRSALDATASIGSGAVAGPISGLAGLTGAVLPGPQGQGADWAQKVQQALTYQPRTEGGRVLTETVAAPFEWLAKQGDKAGGAATDLTGSPTLGTAVNTAVQSAPAAVGMAASVPLRAALADSRVALAGKASRNLVKDQIWQAARDEGFVVPPSEYNPSFVGNRIESVGGKAAIKQQAEIANQEVANKVARREAGLGENDPISEGTLKDARQPLFAPYQQVASISPRAAEALEKLKQARADAKVYWRHYGVSADPASLNKAKALDMRADVLERLIDREATKAGQPDLINQLRDARERLAKNYAVENASVGDGNVNTLAFGQMLDKDIKLTGGLKTLGDFARTFPRFARTESKVPAAGVSKSEAITSALFGAGGAAALGPPGLAAAAVPLIAPPLARAISLSRQSPMVYRPGLGLRMSNDISTGLKATALGIPQN